MRQIGFIGLGIMGKPMAKNLLKAGYPLTVFDLNRMAIEDLVRSGAGSAESIQEVASSSDLILTMLPDSPQVKEVAIEGVMSVARPGTLFIDMSSISPIAAREIHAALGERGIRMVDAPVSGGEPKAVNGTLSIMCGGSEADFAEARPILSCMGSSVVRVGEIGAGNIAKLANQIIVALNIAAVSEAFTLACKAGVDPRLVYDAIRGGLAGSAVMDAKVPMLLEGNVRPGFKIDLHIKDLKNALATATSVGSSTLLTGEVLKILLTLQEAGEGQLDHSAIIHFYEHLAGTELHPPS